jgi:hypothetical protein
MLAVTVKRCGPTPISVHGTYRHRKRHPPRRAERHNPHSGGTVALRSFVQDGFCNGCPLPDHAAIALAISHHRNLNIVRPIFYGSVKPYFGDQYFWCAPLFETAEEYFRHLAASRNMSPAAGPN